MNQHFFHRFSGKLPDIQHVLDPKLLPQVPPDHVPVGIDYVKDAGANGSEAHNRHLPHSVGSFLHGAPAGPPGAGVF